MTLENREQPVERFHPDDIVNDILFVQKYGMGIDPATRSPDYIKNLEDFVKERREKREQPTVKE